MATTRINWQDARLMPEDGKRYEAIDGELYMTPAPTVRHQRISMNLVLALHRLLVAPGHGLLLSAPVGVEFPATQEGVQPDVIFIAKEREAIIGEDWIHGAPDLVIEILSPATAERDRTLKRKLYGRQAVGEYWIVDPDSETVEVWAFIAGTEKPIVYRERLPVQARGEQVGQIDLAEIFPSDPPIQ